MLQLQEGHATPQLGQQLEELHEQLEEGRNAVIETHRELLDMADGAIARVTLPSLCLLSTITADACSLPVFCDVPGGLQDHSSADNAKLRSKNEFRPDFKDTACPMLC